MTMAAAERPPVFELHIRPMFRLLDHDHMARSFDLGDLDAVWKQRAAILTRTRDDANMPGDRFGGPWPAEWFALFERWIATGGGDDEPGHHLVKVKPEDGYSIKSLGGEKRRLTAKVIAPTDGCRVWFELQSVTPGQREYTLYLEPAFPALPADPRPLDRQENFLKGDLTTLVVHDEDGPHVLDVP